MPAVGSSINNSFGAFAIAMASSTRFTSPYASSLQGRSACARIPTCSSRASASARRWSAARRHIAYSSRSCESSAICTFSITVSEAKVSAIWKVRPTPSRQIARGRRPTSSSPSSRIEPRSARNWPLTMLKVVVLPAPFGPIRASSSPGARSNAMPSTALTPPKDLPRPRTSRSGLAALMPSPRAFPRP